MKKHHLQQTVVLDLWFNTLAEANQARVTMGREDFRLAWDMVMDELLVKFHIPSTGSPHDGH